MRGMLRLACGFWDIMSCLCDDVGPTLENRSLERRTENISDLNFKIRRATVAKRYDVILLVFFARATQVHSISAEWWSSKHAPALAHWIKTYTVP